MGTIGGKVGLLAGIITGLAAIEPMIAITPGRCFFEGVCGEYYKLGLALAALLSFAIAIIAGVAVRAVVNRLVPAKD